MGQRNLKHNFLWFIAILLYSAGVCQAQEDGSCYGPGSIAASVILTIIFTALLLFGLHYFWQKRKRKSQHLILETDPEKGKGEYAFDNPGFKDTTILPTTNSLKKSKLETSLPKWNQWSPFGALSTMKSDKRKTLDDSALEESEVKVVALRSHDFTGLGFNICGNIKEGIYIKDILHRGPAFESGKLNPGDKINSVTISFEHMVCEDALTILSYASPYEVIIEARSGKIIHNDSGQGATQLGHPVYRSSSCTDLFYGDKKKAMSGGDYSNYSSLQKSRSNMTTLERKKSKSPKPSLNLTKKNPMKHLSPKQLKTQLEQKILPDHNNVKNNLEIQKTENKYQKFGVKVLPFEQHPKSPKTSELFQNDNNINIERQDPVGIDEVDEVAPPVKKREKKPDVIQIEPEENHFIKTDLNSSGIKRDKNGIPQEIPNHMLNAAVAARRNRKSSYDNDAINNDEETDLKTPKKLKGKAPAPPEEKLDEKKNNYDEIQSIPDEESLTEDKFEEREIIDKDESMTDLRTDIKDYTSDSDIETDNQSSVNTIELNSSDITIHQSEDENMQNRKTVSTGDLTKIQKTRTSSSGTLERAQSLDITDTGISSLKRKGAKLEDMYDAKSEEDLFGKVMLNKAPRLSLILDSLNTFERNSLKKSTEWGNLEDAILKLNQEENDINFEENCPTNNFDFGEKTPEFDALVKKINEIKRESQEISPVPDQSENTIQKVTEKKVKNQIWPSVENSEDEKTYPVVPERTKIVQYPIVPERNRYTTTTTMNEEFSEPVNVITDSEKILNSYPVLPERNRISDAVEPVIQKRQIVTGHDCTHSGFPSKTDTTKVPEEEIEQDDIVDEKKIHKPTNENSQYNIEIVEGPETKLVVSSSNSKIVPKSSTLLNSDELPQSKIPVLSSYNTDETKTVLTFPPKEPTIKANVLDLTENFLFTEKINSSTDDGYLFNRPDDTNVSDDIKVSRHSYESLERNKTDSLPKSDDAKTEDSLKHINISNVTVNNGDSELHSLELSINESGDLYTTALETPIESKIKSDPLMSTPNVTLTETNSTNNDITSLSPKSLVHFTDESLFSTSQSSPSSQVSVNSIVTANSGNDELKNESENTSLTYITEIKVTPNTSLSHNTNVSEIEIIPTVSTDRNLDNEFENYVKNFECNINYEPNIPNFETSLEEFIKDEEPKTIIIKEKSDAEQEMHKIQEIAEEQLKKLPEMRFVTTSYESGNKPRSGEGRQSSQIELLRMNFEKSPQKMKPEVPIKSRIPVATATTKSPPISPERRDSKNLDIENEKAILELMSSTVHSTPIVSHSKYQIKSPSKNVTVTSIRSNSKIPSGLPTLSGARHYVTASKKIEINDGDSNVVNVSTNDNGNSDSGIQQWVFRPSNNNSITNISVTDSKYKKTP